jgi:PAS domain S-box-containing protein
VDADARAKPETEPAVAEQRRLEEELRASEARYRILAETASEAIIMIDQDSKILFVNPATEEIFGYRREEILGQELTILIPPELRPRHLAAIRRYLETGQRHLNWKGVELPGLRKNGQKVPLEIAFGDFVREGRHLFIGYARDISKRKRVDEEREHLIDQLAAERSRLRTVIERAPAGIILHQGTRGDRVMANPRAEELFGRHIRPEGGVSQYAGQIFHPEGRPFTFEELVSVRALREEVVVGEEGIIRQPTGREVTVLASAAPIRDSEGKLIGAIVVFEDISRIRELEREREEWTSVIAHDLRQPVTVIDGYATLLARDAEQYPPQAKTWIEHILASTTQLNRMIADLLDVSRIDARRLTLDCHQVDLLALVSAVVERTAALTTGHPVRVAAAGQIPSLEIDSGRIEQILDNLLSNAAKYGYPNTDIVVDVERRDTDVEVSVTNQGQGIAPEEVPKLFQRFYRAPEARAAGVAGVGLGLYITKGLVEAHGGRIWAESTPGQTTTFHFTLPVRSEPARLVQ